MMLDNINIKKNKLNTFRIIQTSQVKKETGGLRWFSGVLRYSRVLVAKLKGAA